MLDTFGKRLRFLRIDRDIRQKDLADALRRRGVSVGQGYISVLEASKKNRMPNGEVIAGLAQDLQTTSDFLLLLSNDPDPVERSN